MLRIVADLGNSRMKWARLDSSGRATSSTALPPDDPPAWDALWQSWADAVGRGRDDGAGEEWAIASVNPPAAARMKAFLAARGVRRVAWYETASDVPLSMDVEDSNQGGADRALAVLAAASRKPAGRPGLVVSCGTAITIERIRADGTWLGGVIAPGLFLCARALHMLTAQLPLIHPDASAPSWGRGTVDSMEAGLFWGTVGAIKELLARQDFDPPGEPWVAWTGGDADRLAGAVSGPSALVLPDLVLEGMVAAAFGAQRAPGPRGGHGLAP
ncbi:Type III pantothenate kinase [Aquisphaera giovannonii]|uniref:Type III pantothenate kinase n=1 Tax=Aquisphaera giovannonii TaxID=406548 RepID=A0A5B9W991_9BACT|nr:type III pantothenate kinase [Aquisphaera giovannonii]QEH37198.1 Type III pantothenate kinase [Aquisphaera giovannonii]